jgi:hypothetical protein
MLACLKRLRTDQVKIGRAFVSDLEQGATSRGWGADIRPPRGGGRMSAGWMHRTGARGMSAAGVRSYCRMRTSVFSLIT